VPYRSRHSGTLGIAGGVGALVGDVGGGVDCPDEHVDGNDAGSSGSCGALVSPKHDCVARESVAGWRSARQREGVTVPRARVGVWDNGQGKNEIDDFAASNSRWADGGWNNSEARRERAPNFKFENTYTKF
jgi:hypothetical protein